MEYNDFLNFSLNSSFRLSRPVLVTLLFKKSLTEINLIYLPIIIGVIVKNDLEILQGSQFLKTLPQSGQSSISYSRNPKVEFHMQQGLEILKALFQKPHAEVCIMAPIQPFIDVI